MLLLMKHGYTLIDLEFEQQSIQWQNSNSSQPKKFNGSKLLCQLKEVLKKTEQICGKVPSFCRRMSSSQDWQDDECIEIEV